MSNITALTSEHCPICHDSGWVLIGDSAKRCECFYTIRARRINAKSGFPIEAYERMTFENFKADTEEQRKMLIMAESFVDKPLTQMGKGSLGFFGKSGTGKTHICIAVCQELTKKYGFEHRYFSYRSEIRNLMANYYNKSYKSLEEWINCDVLYIDDLMKFSTNGNGEFSARELQVFYELINGRCLNDNITIFSSERSLKEIIEIDSAIGSRIYSMAYPNLMKCEGKNYRITGGRDADK